MGVRFGRGRNNRKVRALEETLGCKVATFSLPAGWTCPFAKDCLAKADRKTGKITDGPKQRFRCFAASDERYPAARELRWQNFEALKAAGTAAQMSALLIEGLRPEVEDGVEAVRVDVSGDFFNRKYALAWAYTAEYFPAVRFYAYTKSVATALSIAWPSNFKVTFSVGGTQDHLIPRDASQAIVVQDGEQAALLGLEVDDDDSHAFRALGPFALKLHGTQPRR